MELPYDDSVFFPVRSIMNTCCLYSSSSIIGVNRDGVHFFTASSERYLHSVDLDAVERFPNDGEAVFVQIRMKANLRILYFETPLYEEFQLAVQACKSEVRDPYSYGKPVSIKREWEQEVAQKDAYEAVINLRHVERKELSQILDRWLTRYLRLAVRKRQQTIRSKEATDDLPDKDSHLGFIELELHLMKEEYQDIRINRFSRTLYLLGLDHWSFPLCTSPRRQNRLSKNVPVPKVRWSSSPTLES